MNAFEKVPDKSIYDVVKQALLELKLNNEMGYKEFVNNLGEIRSNEYLSFEKLKLSTLCRFLKAKASEGSEKAIVSRLIGLELGRYFYKQLKLYGRSKVYLVGHNMKAGVERAGDVVAYYSGHEDPLLFIGKDKKQHIKTPNQGNHYFLSVPHKILKPSIIKHITSIKTKYENVHVLIAYDSNVSKSLLEQIHQAGADVVVTGISRSSLRKNARFPKRRFGKKNKVIQKTSNEEKKQVVLEKQVANQVYDIISKRLNIKGRKKVNAFIQALGEERVLQYERAKFNPVMLYNYFCGSLAQEHLDEIMGYEFVVYLKEYLIGLGSKNVEAEIYLGNRNIDLIAELNGDERVQILKSDFFFEEGTLNSGSTIFEAKAAYRLHEGHKLNDILKNDFIRQIDELLKVNKNLKLFVLSQTKIDNWILYQLKVRNVEVIRAKVDKKGLKKRLDEMKSKYADNMSRIDSRRSAQNIRESAINIKVGKILKSGTKSVELKDLWYIYETFVHTLMQMGSDKGEVHCYLSNKIEGTTMAREVQKNIEKYMYNFYLADILCLNKGKNIDLICFKNMSGRPNLYISANFHQNKLMFNKRAAYSKNERALIKRGNNIFYPVLNGNIDEQILEDIHSLKKICDNVHVVLFCNAHMHQDLLMKVYQAGADIIDLFADLKIIKGKVERLKNNYQIKSI